MRDSNWPPTLERDEADALVLDGVGLREMAERHGTPLWVISRSTLEDNCRRFLDTMRLAPARVEVAYSYKAHNTMAVVRAVDALGLALDASSEYELELARRCGVPGARVMVNGNAKSDRYLAAALEYGVGQVHVDSLQEIERLQETAAAASTHVPCLVRLRLGYDGLKQRVPTFGQREVMGGKFGLDVESGEALRAVEAIVAAPNLKFAGVHHHVGFSGYAPHYSPEEEVHHHAECAREVAAVVQQIERECGAAAPRINLGGGFRPGEAIVVSQLGSGAPAASRPLPALADYRDAIAAALEPVLTSGAERTIQFELGNYVISNAVVLLSTVMEVKEPAGRRAVRYVATDAARTMFTLRGGTPLGFPVVPVEGERPGGEEESLVEIVGRTCVYDSYADGLRLGVVRDGDLLALLDHGAYCETMATQFNGFPRPAVVMIDGGRDVVVKRRETIEDVLARDVAQ